MYIAYIFLILVYFNLVTLVAMSRDIEVVNSGVLKLRGDDMITVFFVTIHHHGEKARDVMTTMVECCEKVTDDDVDCGVIQIHGEHIGMLQPGTTRNVTFLYPNIYAYNRRGYCTVDIWNRGEEGAEETDQIRHKFDFDTTIRTSPEEVPPFLKGFYKPEKVLKCDTTDLDPFDGCNPVDCRLKYSGLRNYYNPRRKRCQRVPVCQGDPSKELPDVTYVPLSNTCRNLEKAVIKEDIQSLIRNNYDRADKFDLNPKIVNIQCHHGEIDVRTGLCVCDKGWKSEAFDPEAYYKSSPMYHMCDRKCHPDTSPKFSYVPFAIGVALALWVLFVVMLCENCNYLSDFYARGQAEEEVTYHPGGIQ